VTDAARDFGEWAALWAEHWSWLNDPAREVVAAAVGLGPGVRLLDVGCGSGELCRLAAARGAEASGIDAAEGMLELARRNAPGADLRAGSMEALPWPDGAFDVVTAFNAFQFAADVSVPIREAARVLRGGGRLAVCNWGPRAEQDVNHVEDALRALLPAGDPAAAPPDPARPRVGEPGVLERLLAEAGLEVVESGWVDVPYGAPDRETAERAFLLDAGLMHLFDHASEAEIRRTIAEAAEPFRRPDGSYEFANRFRYAVGQNRPG
jgi:SAM-dependent methyltransferase